MTTAADSDGAAVLLTVAEYCPLFRKGLKATYRRLADPARRQAFPFPVIRDGRRVYILVPARMVERLEQGRARRSRS